MIEKYTQGPFASNGQFIKANGQIIAEVFALDNSGNPTLPQKANAHLFAASAELLAALREVFEWAGKDRAKLLKRRKMNKLEYMEWVNRTLNQAAAAILKAEGRE